MLHPDRVRPGMHVHIRRLLVDFGVFSDFGGAPAFAACSDGPLLSWAPGLCVRLACRRGALPQNVGLCEVGWPVRSGQLAWFTVALMSSVTASLTRSL